MSRYNRKDMVYFKSRYGDYPASGIIGEVNDTYEKVLYIIQSSYDRYFLFENEVFASYDECKKNIFENIEFEKEKIKNNIKSNDDLITFMYQCLDSYNSDTAVLKAIQELVKEKFGIDL